MLLTPPWNEERLQSERNRAQDIFRKERSQEPLEDYLEVFDQYQGAVEELLETTDDLSTLDESGLAVLTNPALLEAFRYLAGPPISRDDLKILSDAVLSPGRLKNNTEMVKRLVEVVRAGLDRRRFPWIAEHREPTESERSAAVLASAALIATSRVGTSRRNVGKDRQEALVKQALIVAGMSLVPNRVVKTITQAPRPGEFCTESLLGKRKADLIVGLYDQRIMAIECKVSNSATNSVKRLNNDAAAKAEVWLHEFGRANIVPTAVLSGVYKTHNLMTAQERGLTLFWAHDIATMIDWIQATRGKQEIKRSPRK
ncbi:MAG: XamI family restriction endonuclease [Candidatus Acidiferrum sp.]